MMKLFALAGLLLPMIVRASEPTVCPPDNTLVGAVLMEPDYSVTCRPKPQMRLFRSEAVEREIERVKGLLTNPKLRWMFENCFPNTLDTTVHPRKDEDGKDDTFVYTGDIHAMWLRDSGA